MPRERKKNFSLEFRSYSTRARKLRKKKQINSKTSFRHYCLPKQDDIGREIEKKNLVPNSVHTNPDKKIPKKIAKKFKKLKNLLPALFLAKTG